MISQYELDILELEVENFLDEIMEEFLMELEGIEPGELEEETGTENAVEGEYA